MDDQNRQKSMSMKMGYGRFAAMVATSTVVMFILMYQATYLLAHVEYSQSRMWMAIVMGATRSEEHTSELQSLMRISYAVFCLKKKNHTYKPNKFRTTYRQF